MGFDLNKASHALIGVSNNLGKEEFGYRALIRNDVETALKLPRTYTDENIRQIKETIDARQRRDTERGRR